MRAIPGIVFLAASIFRMKTDVRFILATTTVLAVVLSGSPAGARLPGFKREAKRIKKALVRIEFDHDDVSKELSRLRAGLADLDARIAAETQELSSADTPGFGLSFDLVAVSFRLNLAREERAGAETRIVELDALEQDLVAQREDQIAELEEVVEERIRSKRGAPALTINGSLVTYSADWEAVAMCESSGDWHIDSQFDGGLQFHPLTWLGFGGAEFGRYAHQASKIEQIAIAERVLAIQGPGAWPNCFESLPFHF